MATEYPNPSAIVRAWWVIDLSGKTVGRAATQIATLLRGKHKPLFTPHLDVGDFVVCVNAEKLVFTGRKLDQKEYFRYTGFPGNTKHITARDLLVKRPEDVIKLAVKCMLPRNSLGRATFKKLKIYRGTEHPHGPQNPKPFQLSV